ncbi:low molecular weight protein arginine phosphatase [Listeria costaricensis]|uniref:arsenate reductase/protein-tyrosine-phosphatase family protein n=1 Tax=Listeria costaricensis TaxID=2026604 RepID=UPI000C079599|nr:low molecular weight protein arginine phosphatase [Listeria costaricensis]
MHILIVCTGNTCRSPVAEKFLADLRPDLAVQSRGLFAQPGAPLSEGSAHLLEAAGLSTEHAATVLTEKDIIWADEIFVMTADQLVALEMRFSQAEGKTGLLSPAAEPIPDPYGGGWQEYQQMFEAVKRAISERF